MLRTVPVSVRPAHLVRDASGFPWVVTDDDAAGAVRAFDLRVVTPNLVTPAPEDLLLAPHLFDVATHVPRVGVFRDGLQCLPLAAAADHDGQLLLDGRRVVPDALRVV